jgi:hypothetical protein
VAVGGLCAGVPRTGRGGDLFDWVFHRDVAVEEPLAMKELAHLIREIDAALFRKGMVGVKAPDVWGQNRLTKYRAEYEKEMAKNGDKYATMIQAAQRRTDVAALTNAMAFSAAFAPPSRPRLLNPETRVPVRARSARTPVVPVGGATVASPATAPVTINNFNAAGTGGAAVPAPVPVPAPGGVGDGSSGGDAVAPPTLPDLSDIAKRIDQMQATVLNLPNNIVNFASKPGDPGVSLEPTVQLDEQSDYLNHLYQLRRNNVGDDLTDLPGYGLYLIRIPISILPGKATREGKGAVVTFEAKHELTDDLLENTVRDVVVKDVLYKLKEPVLWAIRNHFTLATVQAETGAITPDERYEEVFHDWNRRMLQVQIDRVKKRQQNQEELAALEAQLVKAVHDAKSPPAPTPPPPALVAPGTTPKPKPPAPSAGARAAEEEAEAARKSPEKLALPTIGYASMGPNAAGEAASEMIQIVGPTNLARLGEEVARAISDPMAADSTVFSWLNLEIQNAYRYMHQALYESEKAAALGIKDAGIAPLFTAREIEQIAGPLLSRDYVQLVRVRNNFLARLYYRRYKLPYFDERRYLSNAPQDRDYRIMIDRELAERIRAADILCYMVLAQLIFIDRQIKQDMRVMHERRNFPYGAAADRPPLDTPAGPGLRFYDFRPTPEAKQLFKEYVRCKWPIHVFALDPDVDEQNILDAYSRRTELQMALAVSLAAGKIGFNDATKYARQLDLDLTTIGLNRTAVGFGGGKSTFGWRFYPRVQTPPSPSNPARIVGALLYNGTRPDYDLLHRQMEPGQRECVALVVVPNFVPAIHMMSEANWFGLGPHSHQKFDPGDLLRLSRKLQNAREALCRTADDPRYRPGELARMADRLDQLEELMPTQDFRVDLPDEGDVSGSEIFSSDAAKLGPSLLTWFGEPPMVGKASDVFLVGKGFNVIETHVIAGGLTAPQELLSRNVIRITIPADARPLLIPQGQGTQPAGTFFDVHLATPNGVSDYHMLIPAREGAGTVALPTAQAQGYAPPVVPLPPLPAPPQ